MFGPSKDCIAFGKTGAPLVFSPDVGGWGLLSAKLEVGPSGICCERCHIWVRGGRTSLDPLPNKNKKRESLENFVHMLDMFGHGWAWSGIV